MARRRRKRRGRRGSKAVPIVQTAMLLYPAKAAWDNAGGLNANLPKSLVGAYTGYSIDSKRLASMDGVYLAIALLGASTIGAKIANRVGANRILKKATGGIVKLM